METTYKYKDLTFKPIKKDLKFHKNNLLFIKDLTDKISKKIKSEDGKKEIDVVDETKYWDYIHDEENIKTLLSRLLDGETDKIKYDVETDEDYTALIGLLTTVLKDFFSLYTPLTK